MRPKEAESPPWAAESRSVFLLVHAERRPPPFANGGRVLFEFADCNLFYPQLRAFRFVIYLL